jgi:DNA-binding NarL/FixJ family response regulator
MSRILFVDDDLRLLSALRRSFKRLRADWDCVFATSAEEALSILDEAPADVLVTDMAMGAMNGLELVRRVHLSQPEIPTIILTGTADLADAVEAINEAKVFRFYTKPCPTVLLADGILEAIKMLEAASAPPRNPAEQLSPAAFNLLPLGIFVVDQNAKVEFLNDRAAKLVAQKDGLLLNANGVLRTAGANLTNALHQAIANACMSGNVGADDIALSLSRTSGKRDLSVFIASSRSGDAAQQAQHAMIFVTDPEQPVEPSEKVLREMFDLTHAEARLVRALMQKSELKDAAETANITLQTARSYLRRIFEKTGTSRQAQLVKLVLTSPAMLETNADRRGG